MENTKTAMDRADNALKGIPKNDLQAVGGVAGRKVYERPQEQLGVGRANQFERTAQGKAYRTTYERKPDRITVHLHFENVKASDKVAIERLRAAAQAEADGSVHAPDLPPVTVMVTGQE